MAYFLLNLQIMKNYLVTGKAFDSKKNLIENFSLGVSAFNTAFAMVEAEKQLKQKHKDFYSVEFENVTDQSLFDIFGGIFK